ncbi:hypothetical protein FHS31_001910 [Sphingomonas vulcanisoli]|uniref:Lipoprotein n=1 Tax=Sphingomonas vulcanisoli TaxID=1658060 RepID=A0ABX0TRZ8_9SPHN|nr:hypothetical protein [Sphingomonas vulcanisoli]NIJ08293.1 hypothetical protein [Sphingomonas vulcanisoli]
MKKFMLAALGAGIALTATTSAFAADGCGPGAHRGYYGHCRSNRGPVVVGGPGLVVGTWYDGPNRGYWDGHRYWQHRERWHDGWRYR